MFHELGTHCGFNACRRHCDRGVTGSTADCESASTDSNSVDHLMKICSKCKINKNRKTFGKDSSRKDGLRSDCKKCVCLSAQRYRNTNAGKKAIATAKRKYRNSVKGKATIYAHDRRHKKNSKEKIKARDAVKYALRTGKLQKEPCHCGKIEVQAHHDDYSKPLDVEWLCIKHHKKLYRKG